MMPSSHRAEAFGHQTVHQDIRWEDVKETSGVFSIKQIVANRPVTLHQMGQRFSSKQPPPHLRERHSGRRSFPRHKRSIEACIVQVAVPRHNSKKLLA